MKVREHSSFRTLHDAYFWLVPELEQLDWPDEVRANCSDCVMIARPDEKPARPRTFNPKVRCCTYHPNLANYLVGRLLRDGGRGAEMIRARMTEMDGVDVDGINPMKSRSVEDPFGQIREFGMSEKYICPFYVGGDLACGIWPHREAVCRTWFCLHVEGYKGGELWASVRDTLYRVERQIERWCTKQGKPPSPGDDAEAFERWYIWCAEQLENAARDEVMQLRDEVLEEHLEEVRKWYASFDEPLPDVLEPAIGHFVKHDDGLTLYGESYWDALAAPGTIFALLSRLDGTKPWRQALAEARAETDGALDEELVHFLAKAGALMEPNDEAKQLPDKASSLEVAGKFSNPLVTMRWVPVEGPAAKPKDGE